MRYHQPQRETITPDDCPVPPGRIISGFRAFQLAVILLVLDKPKQKIAARHENGTNQRWHLTGGEKMRIDKHASNMSVDKRSERQSYNIFCGFVIVLIVTITSSTTANLFATFRMINRGKSHLCLRKTERLSCYRIMWCDRNFMCLRPWQIIINVCVRVERGDRRTATNYSIQWVGGDGKDWCASEWCVAFQVLQFPPMRLATASESFSAKMFGIPACGWRRRSKWEMSSSLSAVCRLAFVISNAWHKYKLLPKWLHCVCWNYRERLFALLDFIGGLMLADDSRRNVKSHLTKKQPSLAS